MPSTLLRPVVARLHHCRARATCLRPIPRCHSATGRSRTGRADHRRAAPASTAGRRPPRRRPARVGSTRAPRASTGSHARSTCSYSCPRRRRAPPGRSPGRRRREADARDGSDRDRCRGRGWGGGRRRGRSRWALRGRDHHAGDRRCPDHSDQNCRRFHAVGRPPRRRRSRLRVGGRVCTATVIK